MHNGNTTLEQVKTGPAMRNILISNGIPASEVTRKRDTGAFVASFFSPEMNGEVEPASVLADRIVAGLAHVRIIDRHETRATWREQQPIIESMVIFIPEPPVAPPAPASECKALMIAPPSAIVVYQP